MGKSYEDLGFGKNMVKTTSRAGTRDYTNALEDNIKQEPTPYLHETAISKGTLQTTLGGLTEFKDATGGTTILTYNPDTGVVTIVGSLVANQVNTGTYSNIILAGTPALTGTLTNGVHNNATFGTPAITGGSVNSSTIGTPSITGGTISSGVVNNSTIGTPTVTGGTLNPTLYQRGGTSGVSASIVYVKNLSPGDLGTLVFTGGLLTSSTP